MLGLLRLLTNRQVMGDSTASLSAALDLYDRWRQDPRVELVPEPRGAEDRFRQALELHMTEPATKAIADCYLVGFADAAGARLVTFDKALAAMAQWRQVQVAQLEPSIRTPRTAGRPRG